MSAPASAREERGPGWIDPESALLLASLAIVTWGTFELVAPSALPGSLHPAARGSLVLGLIAFGGAGLSLLGASPPEPPASDGPLGRRLRDMFFAGAGGRESEEAAGRIRLGWARMAASLGVILFLVTGVLSLSPYSAAVLMVIAGSAGVLALRST